MKRLVNGVLIVVAIPAALCFLLTLPGSLHFGHGSVEALSPKHIWADWAFTPFICILTLAIVADYINGLRRRRRSRRISTWRHVAFFTGTALIFLALQSPIDPLADHFFFMHQIEHLMIMHLGALLVVIAMPTGVLLRGLPRWARVRVVKPIMQMPSVRASFDFLGHPAVAPVMFLAAMIFWNMPRFHDTAVLHEDVHYFMHYTMLLFGLFYWWMLCDPRAKSLKRFPWGGRILVLCAVTIGTNVFSAYLTFVHERLYTVYDQLNGAWGISAMRDQHLGALILWIPTSMMEAFVFLALVWCWAQADIERNNRYLAEQAAFAVVASGSAG